MIADYAVEQGNPADGPQLAPAVQPVIKRPGKTPRTVTADRSYGEKAIEDDMHGLGVRHVVIPRKGKPGRARQAAEPPHRQWRTGSEGRISALKGGRRGIWAFSCRPSAAVRRGRTGSILAVSAVPRRRKASHRHA